MTEIPGSPLSFHDLGVIGRAITQARLEGREPTEIIVSSRRLHQGMRAHGLPVRLNDDLGLNEGLLICDGRTPDEFDFEAE